MIQLETKRYHVVLWESADRSGPAAAVKLEFDSRAEATAAFEAERQGTLRRWELIDRFPKT